MKKLDESIKEKWKKVSNKAPYILYLFHLIRNIVILTNGTYINSRSDFIYINIGICLFLAVFLIFFNKKYNIYIISFITGLSIYVLKYSPYADMNRTENIRAIVIYILVMVFQLVLMTAMYVIKRNMRTLILILLSFFASYPVTEFYHQMYADPKRITYNSGVKEIKDKNDLTKKILKLPLVNVVCYKEENTGVLIKEAGKEEYKEELCYYMNDKIKSEENKALLVVSVSTLIDYETIDSLATEIAKFYKLMKKEDRKIILEIYTLKSRENILGEYEIYNGELKKIKLTEDIRYVEDIIENLNYAPTWLLRGGY